MSITLSPQMSRVLEQARVGSTRIEEAQQEQAPEAEVSRAVVEALADAYGAEEASRQAWSNRFSGPAGTCEVAPTAQVVGSVKDMPAQAPAINGFGGDGSVIQQTKDANCGSAVATMLGKSKGTTSKDSAQDSQTMDALESRFTDGNGTTAHELSNMVAHEGAQVTQSSSTFDRTMMDQALARDGKAAVLVDSNKVDPNAKDSGTGRAHWVTVEGKSEDGSYKVKDPGTGKSLSLSAGELEDAVGTSWREHQGGGMLVVEQAQGTTEAERAEKGGHLIGALGTTEGGGSRAKSNFGRESS
ncbi:hypothetical protein LZ198_26755 [Myxococcus sp. K15C18031901]|uniref:hypothetical protein n=1 Tax=Myxococcus dinghuensis TaxID=2906761 RepID=UPI0020A7CCA1|nr:hypothetical protein [Myxococcus dinghuensis]MCP3102479.1 hypothetical protein [Myxococcus dinghuensis]